MFKELIIIVLIAGGIFFGYMLIQNDFNIALTMAAITGMVGGLTTSIGANPTTSGISALSGIAGAGTIAKLAYDGLKKEATQKIQEQNNVIVDKKTELEAIKGTYDTKIGSLESQIEELKLENPDLKALKDTIAQKDKQVQTAVTQREGIEQMHQKFVEDLTSDADTVIDPLTHTIYKVIKLPAKIVVP